jgi:hypothetical protein
VNTRSAVVGEIGFDALDTIGAANNAAQLRSVGLTFALVYVERATPAIVAKLLQERIDVAFLSVARIQDWSAQTGAEDGKRAASKMLALGVPGAVSLGCDLEAGVPDEPTAVAYSNGWYDAARAEGLEPMSPDLYVGAGSGFVSSATLFHAVAFQRYHRSLSQVPNVDVRGYCCLQLYPGNQEVFGVEIDYDVAQQDYKGGTLTFLTS